MKHYEELTTTPVEMTTEGDILTASQEKACKIDPVNVTVENFIDAPENHISKSFSLDIE